MSKLFSIIIPTYKGSDSLPIALACLEKQTFKDFEVIVSDDNGKDSDEQIKTQKVIDTFKDKLNIKYLINKHVNGSYARNQGLQNAEGKYICFLDDDDFYLDSCLEEMKKTFELNKDISFIFSNVVIILKEGVSRIVKCNDIDSKSLLFYKKEIGTGSNIFFRREVYDNDGGFDDSYLRLQDIEFVAKKLAKYKSISLDKSLVVKYYNSNDNFPNFDRNIKMCEKLRDDVYKLGIINKEEYVELRNNQLLNILKDMIVKNSLKDDVKRVYKMIDNIHFMVKASYYAYLLSPKLFNIIFKVIFPSTKENNDSNVNELIKYRKKLEESYKWEFVF